MSEGGSEGVREGVSEGVSEGGRDEGVRGVERRSKLILAVSVLSRLMAARVRREGGRRRERGEGGRGREKGGGGEESHSAPPPLLPLLQKIVLHQN